MNHLDIIENHFNSLPDGNVLDFEDGYSKILGPLKGSDLGVENIFYALAPMLIKTKQAKYRHINYFTFKRLFEEIAKKIKAPVILETGSSAHGTNSSILFCELAKKYNGLFDTIDINPDTVSRLQNILSSQYSSDDRLKSHLGDSVDFIKKYQHKANVVYLDSYDLDPNAFDKSAEHGLLEFEALLPKLDNQAFILIDDTPSTREIFKKMTPPEYLIKVDTHFAIHDRLPGKGELVLEKIAGDKRFTILDHQYQLLIQYYIN